MAASIESPRLVAAVLASVLAVGIGIATNKVTEKWSWTWILALAALASAEVAVATWRSARPNPEVARPHDGRLAVRRLLFGMATLGVAVVVGLIWLVPRAGTTCLNDAKSRVGQLDFLCTMDEWQDGAGGEQIPVYLDKRGGETIDFLFKKSGYVHDMQRFVCQAKGLPFSYSPDSPATSWWALTVGDKDLKFGFVPEYFFDRGKYNSPAKKLPLCNPNQERLAGTKAALK